MNDQHAGGGPFDELREMIRKRVVGQDVLVERLLVSLLAHGHLLLEGVPGLAKTRLLTTFATCISAHMSRIQFTPDLLPSDLVGTEVYRPQTADFEVRKGPIFANILLADEINRAPAKVQSALLQAMQEREVTIGQETFPLPSPFLVLATQNPIEQEGTYPLPEAQVDRFLMKVVVDYPTFDEEIRVVEMLTNAPEEEPLRAILSLERLKALRAGCYQVFVDPKIDRYVVSIVQASRDRSAKEYGHLIDWGASPRASIALKECARALAFVRGKDFVTPSDVQEIAPDVLRHRILPSFEAESRGVKADDIVQLILSRVDVP
ncbi:MAG: MoxR family ATPase [Bdellovibrionales bacterium]|nr:MoxR family ATPase [Bdellovibrionales bacterium]